MSEYMCKKNDRPLRWKSNPSIVTEMCLFGLCKNCENKIKIEEADNE